jgi:predicted nuclease of predicted toxin-antitoxin system
MFLANENFPKPAVLILRHNGYHVLSIQEEMPGIADAEVIKLASVQKLIILTFDRDYGELIFRHAVKEPPAVIFFRDKGSDPSDSGQRLVELLKSGYYTFEGAFTVIESSAIR